MTAFDIKEFVTANWRDRLALQGLVGQPCEANMEWNFGAVPTEKAVIETQDGVIVRVSTWSGLNWSARGGYGSPFLVAE